MDYQCMRGFEFVLPTAVVYGPGTVQCVAEEVQKVGKRPLVVTDPGIRRAGIDRKVTELLEAAGITG